MRGAGRSPAVRAGLTESGCAVRVGLLMWREGQAGRAAHRVGEVITAGHSGEGRLCMTGAAAGWQRRSPGGVLLPAWCHGSYAFAV